MDSILIRIRDLPSDGIARKMETFTEKITPAIAANMLQRNTSNRLISVALVQRFASLLSSSQFEHTHQGIAFSNDGVLLDGQHRLLAICKTGIPAIMQVTINCPSKNYLAVDCGRTKSMSHRIWHETGARPATTQEALGFIEFWRQKSESLTPKDVMPIVEMIRPFSDMLTSTSRFRLSSVPMRNAAIISEMAGKCPGYATEMYGNLVNVRTEQFTPILHSLHRQALLGKSGTGAKDRAEVMCRAMIAFDPDNKHKTKIVLPADMYPFRETVRSILFKSEPQKDNQGGHE